MVGLSADFSGSIPEYYDRCLGPAAFDPFAADLAQRMPAACLSVTASSGPSSARSASCSFPTGSRRSGKPIACSRTAEACCSTSGTGSKRTRTLATGQIRGTPRSLLIEKRGVALDLVIDRVSEALARSGGADPYRGFAQALVVEARR